MYDTKTAQTRMDELSRCRDRSWSLVEDEKRLSGTNPADDSVLAGTAPEAVDEQFRGLIHIGQEVYLPGDQFIGLTTKLFINSRGYISHLAIRTARLFGWHKLVPIESLRDVTSLRVQLSIDRDAFMDLPGYQTDLSIAEEADRALWKDVVLRDSDYHEIDVYVRDASIILNGHVVTSMNQWRAESAVKNISGSLSIQSYLIPDDKLALEVAAGLGKIELDSAGNLNSNVFTKLENGVVYLMGEVSSILLRDEAERLVAEIPRVRGIINEIQAPGIVLDSEGQRFIQPLIGKELLFKNGHSVTVQKVIINPHNRCVFAVVVSGQFSDARVQGPAPEYREEIVTDRLAVLPVGLILYLTHSAGFLKINSKETGSFDFFDPSRYTRPDQDWLPPYPYCTDEVLFLAV